MPVVVLVDSIMAEYLIIAEAIAPLAEGVSAAGVTGLAAAFASSTERVCVLSHATPEQAARQPSLARRLRKVTASLGDGAVEVPLFEGRAAGSAAHLFVLAVEPTSTGGTAALLGSAAAALVADGLFRPTLLIGWGETASSALTTVSSPSSPRRIFVLPEGVAGAPLPPDDVAALARVDDLDAGESLLARGIISSDAVVVPSPSAAAALARHPALAALASDQPIAFVRMGCDDAPHDPLSDPALPFHFSAEATGGKAECRKALARRLSLAVGPRTLLVATHPLEDDREGQALLVALTQLSGLDVSVIVRTGPGRMLAEKAKRLAIQNPGKIAVLSEGDSLLGRELLAATDALLLCRENELTGRAAGLALRYGTLPIAPDAGAFADFLVDFDPGSRTGTGLLYGPGSSFELLGALRRAIDLRARSEVWPALPPSLMRNAPRWSQAAAKFEALARPVPENPVTLVRDALDQDPQMPPA
jgi:hypothetical protein